MDLADTRHSLNNNTRREDIKSIYYYAFRNMTPTNPSNVTATSTAKEKANVDSIDIDALLEKLHQSEARNEALLAEKEALLAEKDALLVEKDTQLSVALANNNTVPNHSLARISEDGSEGDGGPNHFESVSTFGDYLASQRRKARWHNSVLSDLTHATNAMGASNATVRTAEEMRVIRRIDRRAAAEWDHLSCGAAGAEEGTVSGEDHGHGLRTPWYNPPIQRQRWCEDQSLPHINWGDLFFDLFYVGAAFNL